MKRLGPVLLSLGILAVCWYAFQAGQVVQSREAQRLIDSIVVAKQERVAAETIFVAETLKYAVQRTRWDSVRITDTVVVNDTVYVRRDVADSTLNACDSTLAACGSLVMKANVERSLWERRALLSEGMLRSQKRKSLLQSIGTGLIGFGAGSLACKL